MLGAYERTIFSITSFSRKQIHALFVVYTAPPSPKRLHEHRGRPALTYPGQDVSGIYGSDAWHRFANSQRDEIYAVTRIEASSTPGGLGQASLGEKNGSRGG